MKTDIIPSFIKSIFSEDGKEIVIENMEIGIDFCLEDSLLKDIPIVNTLANILGVARKIHDSYLLKQTLTFINEFNNQDIDPQKLDTYRNKLENDTSKADEELGRVLLLLSRNTEIIKSKILAHFFIGYVKGAISWIKFIELTEVLDKMFSTDLQLLNKIARGNEIQYSEGGYLAERLMAMGLFTNPLSETRRSNHCTWSSNFKIVKIRRDFLSALE